MGQDVTDTSLSGVVDRADTDAEIRTSLDTSGEPSGDLGGGELPRAGLAARVGRYVVRREIGVGGMGSVYQAEQDQPRRDVALKLLRVGAGSAEHLRRFERESQLLARLHHPGIAQVYEAGTYEVGPHRVPYIAMELVTGARPITRYVVEQKLNVPQILQLFCQVCDAVHHANEAGVIHRDLKPGNVLVDASGRPKVIDFGVARAVDADQASSPTLNTNVSQLVGTLSYMSPEQAEADPRELDARADVYALGVVLYELLCKRVPHDVSKLGIAEATRVIRETEPTRPSVLAPSLRGDVETVLLTALQKERARRYQTVGDFAQDLRNVLVGDPINARRDSTIYLLRRKSRRAVARHRAAVIIATFILSILAAHQLAGWIDGRFRLTARYDSLLTRHLTPPLATPTEFQDVRMIVIRDGDDLARVAAEQGISDYRADDVTSLRALHGKLMEKLALAGVRVVAFDIGFEPSTGFDARFLKGVRRLGERGVDAVVAAGGWAPDRQGRFPKLAETMMPHVRWGCATGVLRADEPWQIHVAVMRAGAGQGVGDHLPPQTIPSFAMSTAAAARHPRAAAQLSLVPQAVDVRYLGEGKGSSAPAPERIRVTELKQVNDADVRRDSDGAIGWAEGDLVAAYDIREPPDAAVQHATIDYANALSMTPDEWRRDAAGKVVVVCDGRHLPDGRTRDVSGTTPDGRRLCGYVAQCACIEAMLRDQPIKHLGLVQAGGVHLPGTLAIEVAAAIASATVALLIARTPWRLIVVLLLGLILCAGAIATYRLTLTLFNPLTAIVSAVLTCEAIAAVRRLRAGGIA